MKKWNKKLMVFITIFVIVCIAMSGFILKGDNIYIPLKNTAVSDGLPVVGSAENLEKLIEESQKYSGHAGGAVFAEDMASAQFSGVAMKSTASATNSSERTDDYSKTNVQVEGVDESDTVVADGKYIYQVNNGKVVIIDAYPASSMKISGTIEFADKNFNPSEIYVDGDRLVVIGLTNIENNTQPKGDSKDSTGNKAAPYIMPKFITRVIVYNIKDRSAVREVRQSDIEGTLISSRKIGSKLYLVCSKYLYTKGMNGRIAEDTTPIYRDTAISNETKSIDFKDIKYFPGTVYENYLIIGSIDISKSSGMNLQTYLGAGQGIYMSTKNLYVAVSVYKQQKTDKTEKKTSAVMIPAFSSDTLVYKFALGSGNVNFTGKAQVTGNILNQFSMDENNGYFRIATTSGAQWGTDKPMQNNLYVLDSKMNITGKLENIAPGEKIYSVRFMGDRGYLVTFETTDPLFVVDLKDPKAPKILGELKMPGYSNYMQPYDENHIIGIGKDAVEADAPDVKGTLINNMAYYLGMKISIFDVTDVAHPKEMYSAKIGDRGTDSEALYNHKALLFSKEKSLLALPISLFEYTNGQGRAVPNSKMPEYGTLTFQGAYIYNINLKDGLTFKGRITHLNGSLRNNNGKDQTDWYNSVERILYMDDTIYTISKGTIMASDMDTLNTIGKITIPQPKINK